MIADRLVSEGVELPASDVALKLVIPRPPVEFGEPRSELCQLLRREELDGTFQVFDSTHGTSVPET